jgi:hypothetical protein
MNGPDTWCLLPVQSDHRELRLICPVQRGERDREVLDRQAGGVEHGDVAVRLPAIGATDQDIAELSYVVAT